MTPAFRSLSLALALLSAPGARAEEGVRPPFLEADPAALDALKAGLPADPSVQAAYARLRARAHKDLGLGVLSVVHKTAAPASGDKHDYWTLGRYFWMEDGRVVNKDGQVNPEIDSSAYDKKEWEALLSAVPRLSLAYAVGDDRVCGVKAAELLRGWFLDPATRMNPNLNFGQTRFSGGGTPYGIIETAHLPELLDAAGLLDERVGWTAQDREGLRKWAAAYLDWLSTSPLGIKEGAGTNNHATWYDVQFAALALYTGQDGRARGRLESHIPALVASQILLDGSQPLELRRTRSFSYSIYNLQAFFAAARVGNKLGLDLLRTESADGASIRKALDFLLPYAVNPSSWPYRQIEPVKLDPLIPILREAAKAFGERRYADVLRSVSAGRNEELGLW